MAKLTIDNALLSFLIDDGSPVGEFRYRTGDWNMTSLHSRVLPKRFGYEEILLWRFHLDGHPRLGRDDA